MRERTVDVLIDGGPRRCSGATTGSVAAMVAYLAPLRFLRAVTAISIANLPAHGIRVAD